MATVVKVYCGCHGPRRRGFRMVPGVKDFREWSKPPQKTPQYQGTKKGRTILMATMTATQQMTCTIQILDKKGNPAEVDGVPTWLTDNTDVLSLTPAADGMSCLVAAVGALGSAGVTVTADADLGAGVEPLIGTLDFDITGGKASVIAITPGTPTEQP